jgi:hypothetical protein
MKKLLLMFVFVAALGSSQSAFASSTWSGNGKVCKIQRSYNNGKLYLADFAICDAVSGALLWDIVVEGSGPTGNIGINDRDDTKDAYNALYDAYTKGNHVVSVNSSTMMNPAGTAIISGDNYMWIRTQP